MKKIMYLLSMLCVSLIMCLSLTDTYAIEDGWYNDEWGNTYFYVDGENVTGKYLIDGEYYLFSHEGNLLCDTAYYINNAFYKSDENGIITDEATEIKNGWNSLGDDWFYYAYDRVLFDQFLYLDGKSYYLDYKGIMEKDSYTYIYDEFGNFNIYGFDESGVMITSSWYTFYHWYDDGDYYTETFYFTDEGPAAAGEVYEIDGQPHLFDEWGTLLMDGAYFVLDAFYITNEDGIVIAENSSFKEGWNKIGEDYFYILDGEVVTDDFITIDGKTYYMDYHGIMAKDRYAFMYDEYGNEYIYGFKSSGEMIKGTWWTFEFDDYDETFYFTDDGKAAYNGVYEIEGQLYLFEYGYVVENSVKFIGNMIYQTDENGLIISLYDISAMEGKFDIDGETYCAENGELVFGWKNIDGYWYYFDYEGKAIKDYAAYYIDDSIYGFDKDGHMLVGWYKSYNYTYYYGTDGKAYVGEATIGNKKYLFSESGRLYKGKKFILNNYIYTCDTLGVIQEKAKAKEGWNQIYKQWYYVENGKLASGLKEINNKTYYFNEFSHEMYKDDLIYLDGHTYMFDQSGAMVKNGWYKSYNEWTYSDSKGRLVDGKQVINGKTYYFFDRYLLCNFTGIIDDVLVNTDSNGNVVKEISSAKEGWVSLNNLWFYFKDGQFVIDDLVESGNKTYYMDDFGVMVKNQNPLYIYDEKTGEHEPKVFGSDGAMIKNQWVKDLYSPIKYYYYDAMGNRALGWQTISNKTYYLTEDFGMAYDCVLKIDDKYCMFAPNGEYQGQLTSQNGWNLCNGYYYYIENNKPVHGHKVIKNKNYYFDNQGRMAQSRFVENYYFNADGSMAKNAWINLGEDTYYYADENGQLVDGWKQINGKWYYFDEIMANGNKMIGDKLYYFNSNGSWTGKSENVNSLNGWKFADGYWYYYVNGNCYSDGWVKIDGTWYAFNEWGEMVKGSYYDKETEKIYGIFENGKTAYNAWVHNYYSWSYADGSGLLVNDWQKINGVWYYFDHYEMVDGMRYIDGKYHYFKDNGQWVGEYTPKYGWQKLDSKWYYYNGEKFVIGDQIIDGESYYFDNENYSMNIDLFAYNDMFGMPIIYIYGSNGKLVKNQWYKYDGKWYYADENGICFMSCTKVIDGKTYKFDHNGVMI